ncbi:TPA: hypothetical protein VMX41_001809 [Streptococcus pyogenes]|nr:hypothetical protein [Streptococcus pyogenes]
MTKRPSIASLAAKTPSPAAVDREPAAMSAPHSREKAETPYKSILSKVDETTHRQMKILAANEGVPIGDLQVEAINLLFRSRGLPEIAVRVTPDEKRRSR